MDREQTFVVVEMPVLITLISYQCLRISIHYVGVLGLFELQIL